MATDLSIRLYFSDPSSVERFEAIAQAVDESPLARHEWRSFGVATRRPLEYRLRQDAPLTVDQLRAAARTARLGPDESMGSHSSLRCWRRDGTAMIEDWIVADLDVWGDVYGLTNGEDLRMGGRAAITLSHVGPFVVDVTGSDSAYNDRVEENLERLTQFLIHLSEVLQPVALKAFNDEGLYLPFNSHVAYFRSAEVVLEDIALVHEIWERGLPRHRVAPLRTYVGGSQDGALHLWRTPEQRTALQARLSAALTHTPTIDDVKAIVECGRFDTLTKGESFFVLDYPHYVNAFVDRFYLEILEHAGARTLHGDR